MISNCEIYANGYYITFNSCKSKLLRYNEDSSTVAPVFINGELIEAVNSDLHLRNHISTNINDRDRCM